MMKARSQRTQSTPFAPRTPWNVGQSHGHIGKSLRESWSTAPAATIANHQLRSPQREITREEPPVSAAAIEELEQRFFAEGLSEASLLAASEREAEREQREQPPGLGSKLLLGGALCAALAVMAAGTLLRNADGRPMDLPRAATVRIVGPLPGTEPPPVPPGPAAPAPATHAAAAASAAAPTANVAAVAALPQLSQDPQAACAQVLRRGRFREINDLCAAAFAAAPSAPLAARVAELALERGRNGDAAIWARRAIHQNPRHALAFVYLGGAEQELGHPDAARAAFARYLQLEPEGQHADDVRSILTSLDP